MFDSINRKNFKPLGYQLLIKIWFMKITLKDKIYLRFGEASEGRKAVLLKV